MVKKLIQLYKKNKEIVNYIIAGILTTIISLSVYYVLVFTILNPDNKLQLQIANVISWTAGVIFAYLTNRKYVFKSNNKNKLQESVKFVSSRIFTLLFDMLFMYTTVTIFHLNDKIMKLVSNIVIIILNYILSKFLVFVVKDGKYEKR